MPTPTDAPPEASLTEIVSEISGALDWLGNNGAAYGITGPLVLSGWSAGAHLVAMALDTVRLVQSGAPR